MSDGDAPSILLEQGRRLSESVLWSLQRRFFEEQGEQAWSEGIVPQYITSNPFIASAYAGVVAGFLRDCRSAGAVPGFGPLDPGQPVYLVELGAGSGRFAFLFLRRLLELQRRQGAAAVPFTYVMTDLAERNVAAWQTHPALLPFAEAGVLDFARFDAGRDRELVLARGGRTLSADTVGNPVVAIANYFFDGLPQDAFWIEEGQLYESRISVTLPAEAGLDPGDPAVLSRATCAWEHHPAPDGPYYGEPDLDALLAAYRERLKGPTALRFPVTGLRCCRALRALAGGRLLLLSGDKGFISEEELEGQDIPVLALHGSFSMVVNYHALGEAFRAVGGQVLHTAHQHANLCVVAFLAGAHPEGYPETRYAYADEVERFGPDDFYSLTEALKQDVAALGMDQILAALRLGGGDPRLMGQCLPVLIERAPDLEEWERAEVHRTIDQVWETYFPLGEAQDLPFGLGMLLYALDRYPEALTFFQRSEALYGADPHIVFNIGLCHYQLEQWETARRCAERTLELEPGHAGALEMLAELREETS